MRKIMAEKLVDNEIARLTYVEQGLGHSDEGDRTRRLRDALLIVTGRDPEFDGPMAEMVARHVKRVGKAGRVIAELSCGATLREMTPDLAAGTAEEEACGGAGEGAGG
ncbi:MAG: hypothetical protein PHX41_12735, partial [Kiritimatiellae bacterium]|nr:hypothetical protein [Kiritimatiellia bacterium]